MVDEFDFAARRKELLALVATNQLIYRRNGTYLMPDGTIVTKTELKEHTDA